MLESQIATAAAMIRESRAAIAITGAGISVPSGIPDFRSPGSGLWEHHNPAEVASLWGFRAHPDRFYRWLQPLSTTIAAAKPNPGHIALATLQAQGHLGPIITQNIDGLHEAAGSPDVLPVHGHTRTATCLDCGATYPGELLLPAVSVGLVPRCRRCEGVLKPDVILFGEMLPAEIFRQATLAAQTADLVIAVGTSLEVSPVADLPWESLQRGGRLLIVNLGPTMLDNQASLKIAGDVVEVLPAIVAALP